MTNILFGPGPSNQPTYFVAEDARVRVSTLLAFMLCAFLVPSSVGLALVLLYLLILHTLCGQLRASLATSLRRLALFFALIVLINAVLVDGRPFGEPFAFLSRTGAEAGIFMGLRVTVIFFAAGLFLGVSTPEKTAAGMAGLMRPFAPSLARKTAFYAFLIFGFLPLFAEEIERIGTAQRFRGGGLEGGLVDRLRGARLLIVPVIVSAIHRSNQLAATVELRGVRRSIHRLVKADDLQYKDVVFGGVTLSVLLSAVVIG